VRRSSGLLPTKVVAHAGQLVQPPVDDRVLGGVPLLHLFLVPGQPGFDAFDLQRPPLLLCFKLPYERLPQLSPREVAIRVRGCLLKPAG
jgi:hypothetical protein